jgi:hypothetical protein
MITQNEDATNDIWPMSHFTFDTPMRILCLIKESHSTLELTLGMSSKDRVTTAIPHIHVVINLGFHKDSKINSHLVHGANSHVQVAISSTLNVLSNKL